MPRAISLAVLLLITLAAADSPARADVVEARAELYADYAAKLAELSARCAEQKLDDAVETLNSWLPPREPGQLTLFLVPPGETASDKDPAQTPEWRTRWQALRNAQADALMALAKRAVSEHRLSMVYELVVEALRENPDQEQARRMLGYTRFSGGWHTPFEIRQLRAGKAWHDKFGWLAKTHVERYENGERFALGRWMSRDDEAALRRDLVRGWRVETEHYLVTTNHSLEAGVALVRRLETLFGIWQQVFAPYLADEAEIKRRFEGRAPVRLPRQHDVVYYRTRAEYNDALRASQPKIDITLGIYFDSTRTAYFFAGEEQQPGTLFHEATHQLFQETRKVAPRVARDDNFWIVEGIACYMESLAERDGYWTTGGMNAGRVPAARHRLLVDDFYVPLAELVTLGMESLQQDERIAMLYSQSAGLADFLMHAERGRYRDALARYLAALYTGRATPATLAEMTGTSYDVLDRQYRAFMSAGETAVKPF
ncbi:MAG: hypothetical protein WD063_00875 [Pirellulales bacterium]